jgi:hypothetical protein
LFVIYPGEKNYSLNEKIQVVAARNIFTGNSPVNLM